MINYKCPQCGAYMIYNPAKKCLICEYCGKTEDIKVLSAEEQAELLQEAEASSEVWEETVTEETNGEQEELLAVWWEDRKYSGLLDE